MRVSISNIAWPPEVEAEMPGVLAAQKVEAIDVAPGRYFPNIATVSAADIMAVRRWWESRGIAVIGMQALLYGTSGLNLFGPPTVQEAMMDHLRHICRIAGGLGATRLVFGSPRNRDRQGLSDTETQRIALDFFRRLGDIAAAEGVLICLEPNPVRYNCNFMTTTGQAARMVRLVDHSSIRLQFDTGALKINGETAADELEAHSIFVGHVHASEPDLVPLGQGGTNHTEASQAIRHRCADRVVAIEMLPAKAGFALADVEQALALAVAAYGEE
jgi:sugar phosphate isomerase/epimerase